MKLYEQSLVLFSSNYRTSKMFGFFGCHNADNGVAENNLRITLIRKKARKASEEFLAMM